MKIGVLTHNYPRYRGDFVGIFIEAPCREFARRGHQVTVLAPDDPSYDRPMREQVNGGEVDLLRYRYMWPRRFNRVGYGRSMKSDLGLRFEGYLLSPPMIASGIRAALRWARRERPDVLHAHWVLPGGFIAAVVSRLAGVPLVVSIPGSDIRVAQSNPLFSAMARFTFNQAAFVTANSAELRNAAENFGVNPGKIDTVVYGTDPARLTPDAAGVNELRSSLGVGPGHLMILAVGRMVPKKGFDVLLRAMTEPPLRNSPVVAVLIGVGDEWERWQQLGRDLGVADRLRWIGSVPTEKIGAYYNAADVLAMPAITQPIDGLNVCVLDAMSCGKPVIGSDVAGNPLAIVNGVTGLLVPERSSSDLACAIRRLADNPEERQRMGAAGRRRVEEELGWPIVAGRFLELFDRLRARRPA